MESYHGGFPPHEQFLKSGLDCCPPTIPPGPALRANLSHCSPSRPKPWSPTALRSKFQLTECQTEAKDLRMWAWMCTAKGQEAHRPCHSLSPQHKSGPLAPLFFTRKALHAHGWEGDTDLCGLYWHLVSHLLQFGDTGYHGSSLGIF